MRLLKTLAAGAAIAAVFAVAPASAQTIKIALLVKNLGNGFFDAANKGAQEAAKELGNVEVIYTGPTQATPEGQSDIIRSLIAQKVNAIAISANDKDALVPDLQNAMKAGITVISFDSGVAKEGRQLNLLPSGTELIGDTNVKLASDIAKANNIAKAKTAILSATSTATNQNAWIEVMKKVVGNYPNIDLVDTVYGDDKQDKSYTEAEALINKGVQIIIAPTTVGIAAGSQVVEDKKLVGKVFVTGLGLPSEMAAHVKSGASPSFALWNPIDLGYAATTIAYNLATGKAKAEPNGSVPMGRMGTLKLNADLEGPMANPFVFDKSNIDEFSKIY